MNKCPEDIMNSGARMKRPALTTIIVLLFSLISTIAAASYTNVSVTEAKAMIDSNPSLVVIDVRTQSEYDSGHIRNARHIPLAELEGRLDELDANGKHLVYCASGGRSATASQLLVDNGFLYIYNMLGGINAWISARYPVYVKYSSIQEAINNASPGDMILISSGIYYENVVVNKPVSLVGESKVATIVDGGGVGTVIDVVSDNVTISGFEIRNCSLTWEDWGISLNHSSKSNVYGNVIKAVYAIRILDGSENRVIDNSVVGDDGSCVFHGLQLVNSQNNVVNSNNLSLDCHSALTMHNSTNNSISSNYISGHFVPFPFTMEQSHNNSIVGNTMWQPAPLFGGHMSFTESSGNVLYHNAFLADEGPNTMSIDEFSLNMWGNGCEGNFWSNYNGTDLDDDGIGDTYLPWEGVDSYPLMNLYWNPGDIDHDLDVDIFDVVKCGIAYGSTPSDPNWNPHCDIAEPYGVINIFDLVTIAASYGEEYTP